MLLLLRRRCCIVAGAAVAAVTATCPLPLLLPPLPLPLAHCQPAPCLRSYMEACESGSMFEGLLEDNIHIYATTAANAHESSWGE
mgnify:CR=1 FL=1